MRRILFLTVFCLLAWLPGFFSLPPSDRDESRFAQASKQMIETGDYVTIMNGTQPRNRKPIGIYWLQAPFAQAAGHAGLAQANPIWPYRLPSLLGGLLAVWMTYGFGIRLVGRQAAFLGAWILGASVILLVETHMAKTDAALLAATLAAQGLLARAYLDGRRNGRDHSNGASSFGRLHAAGFWIALAAGVLLKGPITPMVSGLTILALLIADRRVQGNARWLAALRWRWGVPLAAALVLPWFIAIGIASHGQFFAQAIGGELASKVRSGDDSHGAPPGIHLLLLVITLFPGSLIVLQALPSLWRDRADTVTRFLLAWIVPSWIVFEAVPTKLPHYVLPLLPALALLGGKALASPPPLSGWVRLAARSLFSIACLALGAAAIALPFIAAPGLSWRDLLGLPAFAAMLLFLLLGLNILPRRKPAHTPEPEPTRPEPTRKESASRGFIWRPVTAEQSEASRNARLLLLCAPLLGWTMLGLELPSLTALWLSPRITEAAREETMQLHGPANRLDLVTAGYNEPSLMFLAGTPTYFAPDAASAAAYLAQHQAAIAAVAHQDAEAFLAAAATHGIAPDLRQSVAGYNYSRGKRLVIDLYALPASAPSGEAPSTAP